MKIAVIQPNFFPFKAYYDLASRVDKFIFLDDTPYTSKSWVNKTLFKIKSKNYYFRVPLLYEGGSMVLTKDLETKNEAWKKKFFKVIKAEYARAPNFNLAIPLLREIVDIPTECFAHTSAYSVFRIAHSVLGCQAKFTFSSINYSNVKKPYYDKILHICKKEKASTFYTFSKNRGSFDERKFHANNISVSYFTSYTDHYSIVDDIMTNYSYRDILEKECNLLQNETRRT